MTRTVEPSADQIRAFASAGESRGPVVMINLLRYRERAAYPSGFAAAPCGGREAYQRYGQAVGPLIAANGGSVVWAGRVSASVIAPEDEAWDDAILVRYPSREAFVQMISSAEYQAAAPHRTAALLDSRLIATTGAMEGFDG